MGGNDLRTVSEESKAILLNRDAIAVDQDSLGKMGIRHPAYTRDSPTQVWFRDLANGDVAVALYYSSPPCAASWKATQGGYLESCSGNVGSFDGFSVDEAEAACFRNAQCAGFSFKAKGGSGYFKADQDCGMV